MMFYGETDDEKKKNIAHCRRYKIVENPRASTLLVDIVKCLAPDVDFINKKKINIIL